MRFAFSINWRYGAVEVEINIALQAVTLVLVCTRYTIQIPHISLVIGQVSLKHEGTSEAQIPLYLTSNGPLFGQVLIEHCAKKCRLATYLVRSELW